MPTPKSLNDSATVQHSHAAPILIGEATERCPLCGQPVGKQQLSILRHQYTALQEQIEAQARAGLEETERSLREGFERRVRAETEKARRAAEQQVKAVMANQKKTIEKTRSAAVSAEREKHFREKLRLEQQLAELQKKLQQQTANVLGDSAELDLFAELKREFPEDQIERISKGKAGGDIIERVIYNGQICGSILFESKNTSRFMHKYVSKLKNDLRREGADHGVLVTSALPAVAAGRQLHPSEGVLIVSPRLAIAVVHLLRQQIRQVHAIGVGKEGRQEQRDALYAFVVSDAAAQLWDQFVKLTGGMREIDKAEMDGHRRVWAKRADLITSLVGLHDRLSDTVTKIIRPTESEASW
jgi:hypothetical protein